MPRISDAKNRPSPSRKKEKLKPSCGIQSARMPVVFPSRTAGAASTRSASAMVVIDAATAAQTVCPERRSAAGKTAPRAGTITTAPVNISAPDILYDLAEIGTPPTWNRPLTSLPGKSAATREHGTTAADPLRSFKRGGSDNGEQDQRNPK